jgi:hypothetical protein
MREMMSHAARQSANRADAICGSMGFGLIGVAPVLR